MICKNPHRYLPNLAQLPDSQGGAGRHLCAGCAYSQGYDHAIGGYARHLDVTRLDESQAGEGRHKDVEAAYNLGYDNGLAARP